MKNLFVLFLLIVLSSCTIGDFPPERNRLHEAGRADCQKTPEKCIDGVPW